MFDSTFWSVFISQFHFIRPWVLVLLIPFVVIIYIRWQRAESAKKQGGLPEHLAKVLTVGEQGWRRLLPLKMLSLLMFFGIIIGAGPTWQKYESPFNEDKAALVVVVDLSESMLEKDVAPSRLVRAQQKINDLIELRDGGKTALIAYAGSAHVVMPLTQDKQVFLPILKALEPNIMPIEGKQAQSALPLIDQLLASEQGASVLVVADGVVPNAIKAFGEYFTHSPHQLLVLGMGDDNREATIAIDKRALENLANDANGALTYVSVDNRDITWLNRQVERHMQISSDSMMPWEDMGYYLLFPMVLLLLLWFRKGWLVQWSVVLVIGLSSVTHVPVVLASDEQETFTAPTLNEQEESCYPKPERVNEIAKADTDFTQILLNYWLDFWLTPDQQGDWYFDRQDYLQAAQHYQDPTRKGIAFYYAAQFKAAQISFMQVPSDVNYFYAANALARQREYIAARNLLQDLVASMKAATDSDAELLANAEHNLTVLQDLIDQINQFSESQSGTTDGLEDSVELGPDEPRTADGFEEKTVEEVLFKETLNAREILGSEDLADKWLSRVEADPKKFLQAKFYLQLQAEQEAKVGGQNP